MGGRLVQASLNKVVRCPYQGQFRVILTRREGPHQSLHGLRLPVEHQAERMVGEQPGRISPVARRLRVPDSVHHLALPEEPSGGPPVQGRHFRGQRPAQLQLQEIRQQVVIAEPHPLRVERHHKRVGVREVQQDPI